MRKILLLFLLSICFSGVAQKPDIHPSANGRIVGNWFWLALARDSLYRIELSGDTLYLNNYWKYLGSSGEPVITGGTAPQMFWNSLKQFVHVNYDSLDNKPTLRDSTYVKSGSGIRVDSVGNTYTITNISTGGRDSTYVKSGTGVRVDSVDNTYTINNITKDSTYIKSGTGIRVDSIGNTYTVNSLITQTDTSLLVHKYLTSTATVPDSVAYINNGVWYRALLPGGGKDSTYVKSGTGIRVDSAGNTYTVNNITIDSTTAGYRIALIGKQINNTSYRKDIDSVSASIPYSSTLDKMVMIDTTNGKIYRRSMPISASDYWTRDVTLNRHWMYPTNSTDSVGIGKTPTARLDVNGGCTD
jgi:hypothetical protein